MNSTIDRMLSSSRRSVQRASRVPSPQINPNDFKPGDSRQTGGIVLITISRLTTMTLNKRNNLLQPAQQLGINMTPTIISWDQIY
jgi:hypothetical protein